MSQVSCKEPFTDSRTTSLASVFTAPLAPPPFPSPPSQPLTLHIQTSLVNLETLGHARSRCPHLYSRCTPAPPRPNPRTLHSQRQTPPPLGGLARLPVLRAFGAFRVSAAPSLHRCLCLPPRQNSTSLQVGEWVSLCVP